MRTRVVLLVCLGGLSGWGCGSKEPAGEPGKGAAGPSALPPEPSVAPAPLPAGAVLLAEVSGDAGVGSGGAAAPSRSDITPAPAPVAGTVIQFSESGGGVAWAAPAGESYQIVHNGRLGPVYRLVGEVVMSPDGRRWAYGAMSPDGWRMVADGKEGPLFDEVALPVFSQDGAHLAYAARAGRAWRLVVDGQVLAESRTMFGYYGFCAADRVFYIADTDEERRGRLFVAGPGPRARVAIAERVAEVEVSADRTRLAAVAFEGAKRQRMVTADLRVAAAPRVTRGARFEAVEQVVFGPDSSVAFLGARGGAWFLVLDGKETRLGAGDMLVTGHASAPVIRPDRKGIGVLVGGDGGVSFREYPARSGVAEGPYEEAEHLVYGGRSHAYAARRGGSWFVVVDGKEGPPFDRVVSPAFSPDGKHLVYRARKDGRRFVVLADATGKTIRQLPSFDQVFPVAFSQDGGSISYGVMEGSRLAKMSERL